MKKITAIAMALFLAVSNIAILPCKVEAASNLVINGVDIGYAPKQYFSETGKECTCHNKGICVPKKAGCVCKHVSGAAQCYGFALWCEDKMWGYNDSSKPGNFKNVGSIAAGGVTKDNIKNLISKTPIGAHIRTGGSSHSMILMSKNDKGFTIAQANGGNNNEYSGYYKCRIGTATYTWSGYAKSSYGKRGIKFIKIPKDMKVKMGKPAITSCKATADTAVLEWKQVSGAEKYKVVRHEVNNANQKIFYTTGVKYTDKGLKPGTTYFYTVYAVNGSEISPRSLIFKIYTKPSAPEGIAVSQDSQSQLTVSWNKSAGANKYKVLFHEPGKPWEVLKNNLDANTTSFVHKGLDAGKKYHYQVVAMRVGEIGLEGKRSIQSVESAQSGTRTKFTKLIRPINQVSQNSDTEVILNWKAAKGDSDKTYVYNIYRDGGSEPINQAYITGTSYTDTNASSGKIHKYRVQIMEKSGTTYAARGGSDNFYAGSKIAKEISVLPENRTAMRISWDIPSSAPDGIKYVVQKYDKAKGSYVKCAETTSTSYVDAGLTAGQPYKYYIQVFDGNGNYLTETFEKSAVLELSAEGILLNKSSVVLKKGESITLEASIIPDGSLDKTVAWTSSNKNVAAVDQGVVTAIAEGSAEITAKTENGKSAVCAVTVQPTECQHTYGEWVVDRQAGCEQLGIRHRVCAKCQAEETEPIPAAGHSYSEELQTTKEATCKEEGEVARVCKICSAKTDVSVVGKAAHTYDSAWKVSKEPTCVEAGIRYRACAACGEQETETIDTVEHKYELTAQTEPTLDGPGTRTYTCQDCTDSYSEEFTNQVNEGAVSVGGAAADVGETVKVPVAITGNPGIAGFTFRVNYDKSVLTPTAITAGDLLKKDGNVIGTFTSNLEQGISASELEQVVAHWNNSASVTEDGILFYIDFAVSSNAGKGSYPIWLEYTDGDITNQALDDVKPDILDNVITIADAIRGDVNLDRMVDLNDGIMLARYLAKWNITFNERQLEAADVYKDNKVNVKDGVRLAQILAGYEDTENTGAETRTFLAAPGESGMPQVTVENFEGAAGDTVYIPVTIANNTGIAGFGLELSYDSAYLSPVAVERGDLIGEGDFSSNLDEGSKNGAGKVAVHWNNVDNITDNGELFTVEFLIKENVPMGEKLSVEVGNLEDMVCDEDLNNVNVSLVRGGVTVAGYSEDIVDPHDFDIYKIEHVLMTLSDGAACGEIPSNGDFGLTVSVVCTAEEFHPAQLVAAAYGADGALLEITSEMITKEMLAEETLAGDACNLHIGETAAEIARVSVFLWDPSDGMVPLAQPVTISGKTL